MNEVKLKNPAQFGQKLLSHQNLIHGKIQKPAKNRQDYESLANIMLSLAIVAG